MGFTPSEANPTRQRGRPQPTRKGGGWREPSGTVAPRQAAGALLCSPRPRMSPRILPTAARSPCAHSSSPFLLFIGVHPLVYSKACKALASATGPPRLCCCYHFLSDGLGERPLEEGSHTARTASLQSRSLRPACPCEQAAAQLAGESALNHRPAFREETCADSVELPPTRLCPTP